MFECFTERSRNTIPLAQNEASRLKHDYVGTGHLLIGLLQVEGGAEEDVLSASGLSLEAVQSHLEEISGVGEEDKAAKPFSRSAKKVLERASETALGYGKGYVGVEHLLLALVDDPESTAARILDDLGVDRTRLHSELLSAVERRDY